MSISYKRIIVSVILIGFLALSRGDTIPIKEHFTYLLGGITSRYAFDFLGWEANSLASKLLAWLLHRNYRHLSSSEQHKIVAAYFATADLIQRLNDERTRLHAEHNPGQQERLSFLEGKLAAAWQRLAYLEDPTEAILQSQVATILAEEGIGLTPLGVFPPVVSELEQPPLLLVVSPREKIEIKAAAQLRPGLDLKQIEALEDRVDSLGVSSLVVSIGGISTYPAMILEAGSRDWVIRTIAHEWVHAYLFLSPLGWRYGQSHETITLNETVADLAAEEIGDKVLFRFYGVPIPQRKEEPAEEPATEPDKAPAFSFNREMRLTRLQVDALLAEGKVAEAEQYMEERRRFFLKHGYVIRKLNQAYFAFYGSYADSPAAVDPIGKDLRALRRRMASLKEFLEVVRHLTSYAELKQLLGR